MNWIREVYLWYLFCCLYRQLVKHLRISPCQTNTCTVMSPTTSEHGFTNPTGGYSNLSACPFAPLSTHVNRSPGERWAVILQLVWHPPPLLFLLLPSSPHLCFQVTSSVHSTAHWAMQWTPATQQHEGMTQDSLTAGIAHWLCLKWHPISQTLYSVRHWSKVAH